MLTSAQRAYARVAHRLQRELVHAQRAVRRRTEFATVDLSVCAGLARARNLAAGMAWGRRGYRLTLSQARRLLPDGWLLQRAGRGQYRLLRPDGSTALESHALLRLVNAANSGEV